MQTFGILQAHAGISRWMPVILTIVFLIHTGGFIYLYIKRRHFYTLLLAIAFPFLVIYYLLKSLNVEFVGMSGFRWTGIIIAAVATVLIIKGFVEKRIKSRTSRSLGE